jgi:uncharacterized membrane protein YgcG
VSRSRRRGLEGLPRAFRVPDSSWAGSLVDQLFLAIAFLLLLAASISSGWIWVPLVPIVGLGYYVYRAAKRASEVVFDGDTIEFVSKFRRINVWPHEIMSISDSRDLFTNAISFETTKGTIKVSRRLEDKDELLSRLLELNPALVVRLYGATVGYAGPDGSPIITFGGGEWGSCDVGGFDGGSAGGDCGGGGGGGC